jgi:hypothetical protein
MKYLKKVVKHLKKLVRYFEKVIEYSKKLVKERVKNYMHSKTMIIQSTKSNDFSLGSMGMG